MVLLCTPSQFNEYLIDGNGCSLVLVVLGLKVKCFVKLNLSDEAVLVCINSIHQFNHVGFLCLNTESLNSIYKFEIGNKSIIVKIKDPHEADDLFLHALVVRNCGTNLSQNFVNPGQGLTVKPRKFIGTVSWRCAKPSCSS
jgi:hypothetical protein